MDEPNNEPESKPVESAEPIEPARPITISKQKNKFNYFTVLLILLAVVILGVAALGYYQYKSDDGLNLFGKKYGGESAATTTANTETPATTTTDETADWKTYENTIYGYSVKYPKDWVVNSTKAVGVSFDNPAIQSVESELVVYYRDNISTASFNDSKATSLSDMLKDTVTFKNTKSLKVGGIDGYETFVGGVGAYYIIYLEKDNHIYELYFSNKENKTSITTTDSNILNSFKLTDSSASRKTYNSVGKWNYTGSYSFDYSVSYSVVAGGENDSATYYLVNDSDERVLGIDLVPRGINNSGSTLVEKTETYTGNKATVKEFIRDGSTNQKIFIFDKGISFEQLKFGSAMDTVVKEVLQSIKFAN